LACNRQTIDWTFEPLEQEFTSTDYRLSNN
jgi:hypothetical protein